MAAFDFEEALERVTIDVCRAHIWDITAVGALDKAVLKFRREGAEVEIVGLNEASATIVDRLGRPRQARRDGRPADAPLREARE